MKKIKQVLSLAKSLGKEHALKDNYILIKVSSQLPPYTDLARGVNSLDHYEVRHPYSDSVIGAFTVWESSRIPSIVKLGIFQNEHKTIGLIEALYEKIKELYPSVPEDFEKYMYSVWGGSPTDMAESGLHAHSMNRLHEVISALKRAPLRKSENDGKGFHDHIDYHIYQGSEHVGTMSGKELNAMMPTSDHRSQAEAEKNLVFHATNTVSGNPATYMKKAEDDKSRGWMIKLSGSEEYHPLVDIVDNKKPLEEGGGNMYSIRRPDGSVTEHHQNEIEDVKFADELSNSMPVYMRD
jgi:hypothetical protein